MQTAATKHLWDVNGFYDPCPLTHKALRIVYDFRGVSHEVIFGEGEEIRLPSVAHRLTETMSSSEQ